MANIPIKIKMIRKRKKTVMGNFVSLRWLNFKYIYISISFKKHIYPNRAIQKKGQFSEDKEGNTKSS